MAIIILVVPMIVCAKIILNIEASKMRSDVEAEIKINGGSAKLLFEVTDPAIYSVQLSFSCPEKSEMCKSRVKKVLGGAYQDASGNWKKDQSPLHLKIKIKEENKSSNKVIFDENLQGPTLSSWGTSFIVDIFKSNIEPGKYCVEIESLINVKELTDVKAKIRVVKTYLGK